MRGTDEEARAALYREQTLKRRQARRDQFVALAGNRQARINLDLAWQPVLLAHLEAGMQVDDDSIDSLEEMYVAVPPKDIYETEIPDELLI